jgi:hypothetical protein
MLPKVEEQLHDNHPCCGCGPHCLELCPNYYGYVHPQWNHCAYCSYVQDDLTYYDGGFLAQCHDGFDDDEIQEILDAEEGADNRVIRIEVVAKGE